MSAWQIDVTPCSNSLDLMVSTALRWILRQSPQRLEGVVLGHRDGTWGQESPSQGGTVGAGKWQRYCLE